MPASEYGRLGQDMSDWYSDEHFITYDPQIDQADINWWNGEISQRLGLDRSTPSMVAQALLDLFPCATQHCKVTVRQGKSLVDLEMTGTFDDGGTWTSAQQINFAENTLWKGLALLPEDKQGQGLSKLLMRNSYELAKTMRLSRLRLRAMEVGSYAWLRYGFRPDPNDWTNILKIDIGARLGELFGSKLITPATAERIFRLLALDDPAAANAIAAQRILVPSLGQDSMGNPVWIPLGRALIAEANGGNGTSWSGSLDLGDEEMVAVFLDYTRPGA